MKQEHRLRLLCGLAAGAALVLSACSTSSTHAASREPAMSAGHDNITLACQGRVEGRTETVEVGAAADGVVESVFVKEGDTVNRGAKLAQIGCPDLSSELQEATSQVDSLRQVRLRLMRGARDEERRMAAQQTAAAQSELQRASQNLERMKTLVAKTIVSKSTFDDAERDYNVTKAKLEEAVRHEQLTNAPPLPEDVAKADADISTAQNRVRTIQEKIGKCTVTAPISGTILRVLLRPGESFSTLAPKPLFTMSDLSVRRVRAEIDERDVLKVRHGQIVQVFSDGDEAHKFSGRVEQVASSMGRKRIVSSDPAEKADHDVLESVILLNAEAKALPVGMRVVVQFLR